MDVLRRMLVQMFIIICLCGGVFATGVLLKLNKEKEYLIIRDMSKKTATELNLEAADGTPLLTAEEVYGSVLAVTDTSTQVYVGTVYINHNEISNARSGNGTFRWRIAAGNYLPICTYRVDGSVSKLVFKKE